MKNRQFRLRGSKDQSVGGTSGAESPTFPSRPEAAPTFSERKYKRSPSVEICAFNI